MLKNTILLLFVWTANSQIVINPDSLSVSAAPDTVQFIAPFEVTNNYTSTVSFWWKLHKDDSFPEEWKFQICDANTCYFEGVDQCPGGNPNVMPSGVTNNNFSIKIKPKGVSGSSLAYFTIYADADCTTEVVTLPVFFDVGTSGTPEITVGKELTLYPNPTVDKFMLNKPKGIS